MQNLYSGKNLTVTRQKDGSVFLIRQDERPQVMMTLTSSEWLQMMAIELITNDKVEQLHEILKPSRDLISKSRK